MAFIISKLHLLKFPNTLLYSIALTFCLIIFGKVVMFVQVHLTLKAACEDRGVIFSWRAYSIADIAKYIPGGVWGLQDAL